MNWLFMWIKQPTSVVGISTLLGTVSALLSHQLSLGQAVPLIAGAVASIVLPDNADAKGDAQALASSIVQEINKAKGQN